MFSFSSRCEDRILRGFSLMVLQSVQTAGLPPSATIEEVPDE